MLWWMISVYGTLTVIYILWKGFTLRGPFFYVFAGFFLLDILPTLLVHFQYWLANRNALLMIDRKNQKISYSTPQQRLRYGFDEITSFKHFASYGGGAWYSFSEYRYFKITFVDNSEIIVTCLMMKDIKDVFELLLSRKAEKKLSIVAFIK